MIRGSLRQRLWSRRGRIRWSIWSKRIWPFLRSSIWKLGLRMGRCLDGGGMGRYVMFGSWACAWNYASNVVANVWIHCDFLDSSLGLGRWCSSCPSYTPLHWRAPEPHYYNIYSRRRNKAIISPRHKPTQQSHWPGRREKHHWCALHRYT